ncbi:hypothetical protein BJ138DRAFT_1106226 [Hygrophoropsis aurantiaca]|uniref:Uncharacterized protein n=1 Tax=Hygrophoropsis aurantiaca TaxID=72124 RepID=A0ACB7ZW77_9AGAM|nr:hypothetical protein BJ138DRAFT_1106226 [Hygrophoropsis aurantiaca]
MSTIVQCGRRQGDEQMRKLVVAATSITLMGRTLARQTQSASDRDCTMYYGGMLSDKTSQIIARWSRHWVRWIRYTSFDIVMFDFTVPVVREHGRIFSEREHKRVQLPEHEAARRMVRYGLRVEHAKGEGLRRMADHKQERRERQFHGEFERYWVFDGEARGRRQSGYYEWVILIGGLAHLVRPRAFDFEAFEETREGYLVGYW